MTEDAVNMTEDKKSHLKGYNMKLSTYSKEDKVMNKKEGKKVLANVATSVANTMLSSAANSRCVFVYHQPKQPENLKKSRKF